MEWSERLSRYAAMLPELQRGLPVPDAYKAETPGTDSDLNAYDVVYYAGDCNAGSKTIAINLPNDEQVQLEKGTRRLQLKNAMRAKFDKILLPIADELIAPDQRRARHLRRVLRRHDVPRGRARARHQEHDRRQGHGARRRSRSSASGLEEGKADVLGLYMVTKLHEQGELTGALEDYYVTFLAGIFRSVRFGARRARTAARTWCASTSSPSAARSRATPRPARIASTCAKMREAMDDAVRS